MFPQSELDNYKLQVELLQEKLQRSEISRQHLEHKLDKILYKRDEHDKVVRSKAKQKYQQFLEEQQQRNERNKQLVQMLEHIEQQTEVMNARSERLKMMKLQYEMYFAQLVHSQTRRCIQSSVPVNMTPMIPSTTLTEPVGQSMMPAPVSSGAVAGAGAIMDGYNYTNDINSQLMTASYPRFNVPIGENQQFLRSQIDPIPSSNNMELPSLANFKPSQRNEYMDLRNFNSNPTLQSQQQYEFQTRQQTNPTAGDCVENQSAGSFAKIERDPKLDTSTPTANENRPFVVTTNSISKDQQYLELDKISPLSTNNTSYTIDGIPNTNVTPQTPINLTQSSNTSSVSSKNNNVVAKNKMDMFNETITSNPNQETNNSTIISQQKVSRDVYSSLPQDLSSEIQKVEATKSNEIKPFELKQPIIDDYVPKSYEIKELQPVEHQMPETSINASKYAVNISTTNKIDSIETANLPYTPIHNTLDSNSSTTPVSIEKIENAIYGELLTPLETTTQNEQQINSNLTPKLLENLVTQSDNIEKDITLEEAEGEQQQIVPDSSAINYNKSAISNDYEQQPPSQNYDQPIAYDYNTQQNEATATNGADYAAYDNNENTVVDENTQQQQYDYSNYDPSQYSYPGYIYDESTGEYKADPNATVDQYAADQQYAVEGYDPQQYQQQEGYDYSQAYAEDPSTATATTAYETYDTTQQENTTNSPQIIDDAQELQPQLEVEPIELQPETVTEPVTEELTEIPVKITKPTSILSTADKNETQKKKKRVNFVDSSETDESMADKGSVPVAKTTVENTVASSESDFDFSSSTDTAPKPT